MEKPLTTQQNLLNVYVDSGVVQLEGEMANNIYKQIKDGIETLKFNPNTVVYTDEVEDVDGSITAININKISAYKYYNRPVPSTILQPTNHKNPDEFDLVGRLTHIVKQNKTE